MAGKNPEEPRLKFLTGASEKVKTIKPLNSNWVELVSGNMITDPHKPSRMTNEKKSSVFIDPSLSAAAQNKVLEDEMLRLMNENKTKAMKRNNDEKSKVNGNKMKKGDARNINETHIEDKSIHDVKSDDIENVKPSKTKLTVNKDNDKSSLADRNAIAKDELDKLIGDVENRRRTMRNLEEKETGCGDKKGEASSTIETQNPDKSMYDFMLSKLPKAQLDAIKNGCKCHLYKRTTTLYIDPTLSFGDQNKFRENEMYRLMMEAKNFKCDYCLGRKGEVINRQPDSDESDSWVSDSGESGGWVTDSGESD